ncbi:MAG: M67 family metallopeptidase, partial [Endomicrobiia bacterium]
PVNDPKGPTPHDPKGSTPGIERLRPLKETEGSTPNIVTKVYKMTNISENPETCYFMNPEEQIKIFKDMRTLGIEMVGIYHSHLNAPAYPSQKDINMAFYREVYYMIISLSFNVKTLEFNEPIARTFKIIDGDIFEEKILISEEIK